MLTLLAALQFALPTDTVTLQQAGNRAGVPVEVMYAVKWMESRVGRAERVRGPGREQCDSLGCRRVCREIGPYQLNPCINWSWLGMHCDQGHIREYYHNVSCAASLLSYLYTRHHSWPEAIRRYNGSGPKSREYMQRALAYVGWLSLRPKRLQENIYE
jgi:hypothetical protein